MANGLFTGMLGFNPVDLQQKRMQQFLAPIQQAQNPYERIGAALGTIGGGALFGIEDPQLQRASKIRSIMDSSMQDVDITNPTAYKTSLLTLAENLKNAGETDAAMYAISEAAKLKTEKDKPITLTPGGSLVTPTGELIYQAPDRDKQDKVKPSASFAEVASELGFGAKPNLDDYTPEQSAAVNALLERRGIRRQEAGAPKPGAVPLETLARGQGIVDKYVGDASTKLAEIPILRTNLKLAMQGDSAAFEQVRGALIKLVGDSQISNAERARVTGGGGLIEDAIGKVNVLLTGNLTDAKLREIERIVVNVEKVQGDRFNRGRSKAETVLSQGKIDPETRAALLPPTYTSSLDKAAVTQKAPSVGTIQSGFRFKGGNPADKNNWEQVK